MSGAPFDVMVCGSLHLDIMVYAPSLPRLDETVVGSRWDMTCGGKGGNQAVMAARAGARVGMIGRVGNDDFGARLLANLAAAGVDATAIVRDAAGHSGMSVAVVRDDGEYGAVIVSEANLHIDPLAIPRQWRELNGARILILQNEVPEAVNIAAARAAHGDGARVLMNAAPARPISDELLDLVDALIVNRIEAEMVGGEAIRDAQSAMRSLPRLGGGKKDVIVTLGADGLVVQPKDADPRVIPARPVAVVSTHGAGDCFVGALGARLAMGATLLDACRFANDAAADHVSSPRSIQEFAR